MPMEPFRALAVGIDLAWRPVTLFCSVIDAVAKLQQEAWLAMTERATNRLRARSGR
ncbi:hypothetical protein ACQPZQ_43855 [Pseudonocardia sp. CA-142604]|uniref:hypothetical protein n=1 Tax=Pseudonocardia sp. CA-142604 TaxID=3240024 RepID=UPI003D8B3577